MLILAFVVPETEAVVIFDDGQVHNIDYHINGEAVYVYNNFWDESTTINVVTNANIYPRFFAQEDSLINISGGALYSDFLVADSSQVIISGGQIRGHFVVTDSSQVTITGGKLKSGIDIHYSGTVDVYGGQLEGRLALTINARLTFYGSNFVIDGRPVYGTFSPYGGNALQGHLTGTLVDGSSLNSDLLISNYASLTLVPEPTTIVLLGLGSLILLRKRRSN